jgi:hypothetical protein
MLKQNTSDYTTKNCSSLKNGGSQPTYLEPTYIVVYSVMKFEKARIAINTKVRHA